MVQDALHFGQELQMLLIRTWKLLNTAKILTLYDTRFHYLYTHTKFSKTPLPKQNCAPGKITAVSLPPLKDFWQFGKI